MRIARPTTTTPQTIPAMITLRLYAPLECALMMSSSSSKSILCQSFPQGRFPRPWMRGPCFNVATVLPRQHFAPWACLPYSTRPLKRTHLPLTWSVPLPSYPLVHGFWTRIFQLPRLVCRCGVLSEVLVGSTSLMHLRFEACDWFWFSWKEGIA